MSGRLQAVLNFVGGVVFLSHLVSLNPAFAQVPQSALDPTAIKIATEKLLLGNQAIDLYNQAITCEIDAQFVKAEELLRRAHALSPDKEDITLEWISAIVRLGKNEEALAWLIPASEKSDCNPRVWFYLGKLYMNKHQMPDAISAFQKFLQRDPSSKQAPNIRAFLETASEQVNKKSLSAGADNYLVEVFKSGVICRWPVEMMPLKIYFAPVSAGLRDYRPEFPEIVKKTFGAWANVCPTLSFTYVDAASSADIVVSFIDDPTLLHNIAEQGEARYKVLGNVYKHAELLLLTRMKESTKTSDTKFYRIALHEIGHALGIDGHSSDADDIMAFAITNGEIEATLSPRDIKTINMIYAQK